MKIGAFKYWSGLVIFCVLISTLPVLAVGIFSYVKAASALEDKVVQSHMQLLQQSQMNVEQVLKIIDNSMTQFAGSTAATKALRSLFTGADYEEIAEMTRVLQSMQTYELGIDDIHFVNLRMNWSLSNKGMSRYYEKGEANPFFSLAQLPATSVWISDRINSKYGVTRADRVSLVKKLPVHSITPSGLLVLQMPVTALSKLVSGNNMLGKTAVFDKDNQLLWFDGETEAGSQELVSDIIEVYKQHTSPSGYVEMELKDADMGVLYRKSAYNGWTYMYISSVDETMADSRSIGWFTLYVCLIISLFTLLLSLQRSRKMYKPIHRLFQYVLGENTVMEGGEHKTKDELAYIHAGFHTLKQSRMGLLHRLKGQELQLHEFFIRKLLLGEVKASELREKLEQFGIHGSGSTICCAALQIDTLDGTRYDEKDRDLLMFAISNIVAELVESDCRLMPVVMSNDQITLFLHQGSDVKRFLERVIQEAETIQQTIKQVLDLPVSIGISRIYENLSRSPEAYKESIEALKYRVRFGQEVVLYIEDVLPERRRDAVFPGWIGVELVDSVKMADLEHAEYLLGMFMKELFKQDFTFDECYMYLNRLMINLIDELRQAGEPIDLLLKWDKPVYEQLLELKTAQEIERWFLHTVIRPIVEQLDRKREQSYKKISDKVLKLIHEEYDSDLTLEVCSSRFNYHASYIKSVFRKEVGMSFSEYLSQYRLQIAKQWLRETDMKIIEIAERLRFNNSQNFIRYFRKLEEVTPGQYRDSHRKHHP